jgi:thioredoxin reductase (NADPH)
MRRIDAEVIIVGGGLAGLSAAIYLGRAQRKTLVVDSGKSMARWEPNVQNFIGFPKGVAGDRLIRLGRQQAQRYGVEFRRDEILGGRRLKGGFLLRSKTARYRSQYVLLATGIFHVPPDIPKVTPCLGHSMFFCKDCDGFRVRNKPIAIYGWTNEAVEYALAMLFYSPCVSMVTDGRQPQWDGAHARRVKEYKVPVYTQTIRDVRCGRRQVKALELDNGVEVRVEALFTTRGDIYHNRLAKGLGARVDAEGQIMVDDSMRTSVGGLYAAGCVTPSNCQMIIAAGQGAAAAQAINRDFFERALKTHSLRQFRQTQIHRRRTKPLVRKSLSESKVRRRR